MRAALTERTAPDPVITCTPDPKEATSTKVVASTLELAAKPIAASRVKNSLLFILLISCIIGFLSYGLDVFTQAAEGHQCGCTEKHE